MKVKIYGTPDCTYCVSAKKLCESNDLEYEYIVVETVEQLQAAVGKPVRSVPQIFVDGVLIGGFSELVRYVNEYLYGDL